MLPIKVDVINLIQSHYDLSLAEAMKVFNAPTHPHGMRDDFAGQAMQGMLVGVNAPSMFSIAILAYRMADAMLAERIKEKPNASIPSQ